MGNAHRGSILFLLFLGTKSLLSLERTDRLLINSDPQTFQDQISHLTQELNTLYSEINNLRTQVATQNKVISSSRGMYIHVFFSKSHSNACKFLTIRSLMN